MPPGPHIYGDGRIGCWFIWNGSFRDKLIHRVPRVKPLGVTDCFLPREADLTHKQVVLANDLFAALYETPPHGLDAVTYAQRAVADINRLKLGALELNIEGISDFALGQYVTDTVAEIRRVKPNLRLRINCVPWKAQFLPAALFQSDPQLFLLIQNFLGNMDARVPEDQITRDAVDHGIPAEKVSVMYGAHISPGGGRPRVPSLPGQIRYRGSFYQDDLLANGGYIS